MLVNGCVTEAEEDSWIQVENEHGSAQAKEIAEGTSSAEEFGVLELEEQNPAPAEERRERASLS